MYKHINILNFDSINGALALMILMQVCLTAVKSTGSCKINRIMSFNKKALSLEAFI